MTIDEIENILLVFSDKANNEELSKSYFTILYRGYSKFLYSVVSRTLKSMGIYDEQILNTVVSNTFYKLYDNPLIFSFRENSTDDKSFKAWISVVAKNELLSLLKEYYGSSTSLEMVVNEPVIESEEISDVIYENINLKILNDALSMLSERDRHILTTLYLYYEEGKNTPSSVLKLLCKMYDTTNENIRKIKERSEKKIIDFFSKQTQLKPVKYVK